MYDSSGEFSFAVGIPTKSGVGGGLMIVIPGVMGICTFSPRLDAVGNSVRGTKFMYGGNSYTLVLPLTHALTHSLTHSPPTHRPPEPIS